MRTQIIIGAILLSSAAAKAYMYSDTINHNKTAISHNKYYAIEEKKYISALLKAKDQHERDIEAYRRAHVKVMKSDARVRELEANMPAHREYVADWNEGTVQARIR
jgi:hypothetical protein